MAAVEARVTKTVGEFPYGPPPPNEVALASGAARALMSYRQALASGETALSQEITVQLLDETQAIAQARLARAVIASFRITNPPIENRTARLQPDDSEATGATNDVAELQQIHDMRMREIDQYAQKAPYGVDHEVVLEMALCYVAGAAEEDWQIREVQDVAASRGYSGMLALLTTTIPDTPATIEQYARTS